MDQASLEAEGWELLPTIKYSAAVGPTYRRHFDGRLEVALLAHEHIGNDTLGIIHGGAIMTFGDIAFGCAVGEVATSDHFVTAHLQFQFVSAAPVDTLVLCRPEIVRQTSQLVFVRGLIEADGKTVASADGIFKMIADAKAKRLKAS